MSHDTRTLHRTRRNIRKNSQSMLSGSRRTARTMYGSRSRRRMADAMCETATASTLDENVPSAIPRMIPTYTNKVSYGQQSITSLRKRTFKKRTNNKPRNKHRTRYVRSPRNKRAHSLPDTLTQITSRVKSIIPPRKLREHLPFTLLRMILDGCQRFRLTEDTAPDKTPEHM